MVSFRHLPSIGMYSSALLYQFHHTVQPERALPQLPPHSQHLRLVRLPTTQITQMTNLDQCEQWVARRYHPQAFPTTQHEEQIGAVLCAMAAAARPHQLAEAWLEQEVARSMRLWAWQQYDMKQVCECMLWGTWIPTLEMIRIEFGNTPPGVVGPLSREPWCILAQGALTAPWYTYTPDIERRFRMFHAANWPRFQVWYKEWKKDERVLRMLPRIQHQLAQHRTYGALDRQRARIHQSDDLEDLVRRMPQCMLKLHKRGVDPEERALMQEPHLKRVDREEYYPFMAASGIAVDQLVPLLLAAAPDQSAAYAAGLRNEYKAAVKFVEQSSNYSGTSCRTMCGKGLCPLSKNTTGRSCKQTCTREKRCSTCNDTRQAQSRCQEFHAAIKHKHTQTTTIKYETEAPKGTPLLYSQSLLRPASSPVPAAATTISDSSSVVPMDTSE